MNTGIKKDDRAKIAEGLSRLLADTYTLYLQTHNFHWNVVGPNFSSLHLMFETQYNELALAVDTIAERIRALGHLAPGSYKEFSKLSVVKEHEGNLKAEAMVQILLDSNEAVAKTARSVLPLAQDSKDEASADLCIERMQVHEKVAWMLRSILQ